MKMNDENEKIRSPREDAIPRRDMIRDLVSARLRLGKEKYGHGVCTHKDTRTWGTPKDSWMEMAEEEFADALASHCRRLHSEIRAPERAG